MTCNYAQGSYSAQYDDNCMRGFYRSLPTLPSKLLFSPFLSHPPVCLASCLSLLLSPCLVGGKRGGASFTPIRSGPQPNEHF